MRRHNDLNEALGHLLGAKMHEQAKLSLTDRGIPATVYLSGMLR